MADLWCFFAPVCCSVSCIPPLTIMSGLLICIEYRIERCLSCVIPIGCFGRSGRRRLGPGGAWFFDMDVGAVCLSRAGIMSPSSCCSFSASSRSSALL
jgi:hypothetical protein